MSARVISARIIAAQGWLLIAVALLHQAMTHEIGLIVSHVMTAKAFAFVWPPYALDHVAVGILLAGLGAIALITASGIKVGEKRSWWIGLANALTIFALSPTIALTVGLRYFAGAPPFLIGAASIAILGVGMLLPLLWVRREIFERQPPPP